MIEAFENGLRNLGWVAGQNMILEYRYAEGRLNDSLLLLPNWSTFPSM